MIRFLWSLYPGGGSSLTAARSMSTKTAVLPATSDVSVSTKWLRENLGADNLVVIDASWHMPAANRSGSKEFETSRIPGSRFFDIDLIADTTPGALSHTFPSRDVFQAKMRELGIKNTDVVVAYDTQGVFSSARAWSVLKMYGHDSVWMLDGGFPKWVKEGGDVDASPPLKPVVSDYAAAPLKSAMFRGIDQVIDNLASKKEVLVDARSAGRFNATAPEPRAGVRGGHIPGSKSVPFDTCLTADKTFKSPEELRAVFAAAGVQVGDGPIVASCGTGVTANVVIAALKAAGHRGNIALFDGSWTEWGLREDLPLEK